MASGQTLTSHIEVERKFIPTDLLEAQLDGRYGDYERLRRLQGGSSAAQQSSALSFFRLPDKEIKDKYVDYQDRLSTQGESLTLLLHQPAHADLPPGIWMRNRSTRTIATTSFPLVNDSAPTTGWQAKLRLGGDFTSSQMLEATGRDNMKYLCSLYLPGVSHTLIEKTAVLTTRRRTYVVQKPFGWNAAANGEGEIRVVVDEVSAVGKGEGGEGFKHEVGEVEMTAVASGGESNEQHDLLRRRELARLQARVDEFVARNALSFPTEGIKGELEALFEWKKEQERERTPKAREEASGSRS